jgi:hypothetical protein
MNDDELDAYYDQEWINEVYGLGDYAESHKEKMKVTTNLEIVKLLNILARVHQALAEGNREAYASAIKELVLTPDSEYKERIQGVYEWFADMNDESGELFEMACDVFQSMDGESEDVLVAFDELGDEE